MQPQSAHLIIVTGLTMFRAVAALLIAVVLFPLKAWIPILVLTIVAFATDWVDGWLARRWRVVSSFGKIADPMTDKAICLVVIWLSVAYYQTWPYVLCAGVITGYDIAVIALRYLSRKTPQAITAASKVAKLKTMVLMAGLVVVVAGIVADTQGASWHGAVAAVGVVILFVASALSIWSLVRYARHYIAMKRATRRL